MLFQISFRTEDTDELIETAALTGHWTEDEFSRRLVAGTLARLAELDEIIAARSIGWKTKRISRSALTAMRMCCYELFHEESVPVSVAVNEAVDLAKLYGSPEDASFVNGVLGTVVRTLLPERADERPADTGAEAESRVPAESAPGETPADGAVPARTEPAPGSGDAT